LGSIIEKEKQLAAATETLANIDAARESCWRYGLLPEAADLIEREKLVRWTNLSDKEKLALLTETEKKVIKAAEEKEKSSGGAESSSKGAPPQPSSSK
jgi:hypothetical protein